VFGLTLVAAEAGDTPVVLWLMKKFKIDANRASPADRTDGFEMVNCHEVCPTLLRGAIASQQEETALALLALEGKDLNLNGCVQWRDSAV